MEVDDQRACSRGDWVRGLERSDGGRVRGLGREFGGVGEGSDEGLDWDERFDQRNGTS